MDNSNLAVDVSRQFSVSRTTAERLVSGEANTHPLVRRLVSAFIRRNSATLCGCKGDSK